MATRPDAAQNLNEVPSREQYQLVAEEIERVLNENVNTDLNQLQERSDDEDDDIQDDENFASFHESFNSLPSGKRRRSSLRRLSLPSSLRRRNKNSIARHQQPQSRQQRVGETNGDLPLLRQRRVTFAAQTSIREIMAVANPRGNPPESSINAYNLFDSAGGQRHNLKHSTNRQNTVIYDTKKYGPTVPFLLTPILTFLAIIFAALLVIRIFVSLLTLAVGWILVLSLSLYFVHEILRHPIRLFRRIHSRPITSWAFLGALFRLLHRAILHGILVSAPWVKVKIGTYEWTWERSSDAQSMRESSSSFVSTKQDLIALWGLLEGLVLGIEIGALWLVVLGNAAEPSQFSVWMHRRIWRPIRRQYRDYVRQRRQLLLRKQLLLQQRQGANKELDGSCLSLGDDRKQCMICLDGFAEDDYEMDETHEVDDLNISSLYRRRYLPCKHCFHSQCLLEWLQRKASCPICRISLAEGVEEEE